MTVKEHYFCIAGFWLVLHLPEGWDTNALLPSFQTFRRAREEGCKRLIDCVVEPLSSMQQIEPEGTIIEETANDAGYIRLYANTDGYDVTLSVYPDSIRHYMQANKEFSSIRIFLYQEEKDAGRILSSLLRVAYSQAILLHDALSIHASAIHHQGSAFLFMGKSGTGKSTHSALWMKHIPKTELLNDDNPTVRIICDRAYAWGTPWSGKTPCYKNLFYPIEGMVRLNQATENSFRRQEGTDAFVTLLPGCSVISQDPVLRNKLYDTLSRLSEIVPVATLDCRPDKEAALLCNEALTEAH